MSGDFRQELRKWSGQVADVIADKGAVDATISSEDVARAVEVVTVRNAMLLAEANRRRLLAWALRRWLRQLRSVGRLAR